MNQRRVIDLGQLVSLCGAIYMTLLGGFAAITAATAIEEDDAENLAKRVFWSVTKTSLFLGLPALVAVMLFLNGQAGSGSSGIMSKNLGLVVLIGIGLVGLFALWLGAITMGFIGAAVAKKFRPMVAAIVVFLFIAAAPLLIAASVQLSAAERESARLHRR